MQVVLLSHKEVKPLVDYEWGKFFVDEYGETCVDEKGETCIDQ